MLVAYTLIETCQDSPRNSSKTRIRENQLKMKLVVLYSYDIAMHNLRSHKDEKHLPASFQNTFRQLQDKKTFSFCTLKIVPT